MLSDEQMRLQLQEGHVLVFEGLDRRWQEVEQQVDRLGFGDEYLVLQAEGMHGKVTKVTPAPT
jgi:preprotein translocase subunit YajC